VTTSSQHRWGGVVTGETRDDPNEAAAEPIVFLVVLPVFIFSAQKYQYAHRAYWWAYCFCD